uniref:Septin-6 n=1 Tax=Schistosoma japonicum TaxID=6182 RepID=C1L6F1_SCHJA|nr:Septin-6 [Schistosoma japonicum]
MTADVLKSLPPDVRTLKLTGHVGFDSLPDQLVNKAISQGFVFNILCVGETGIGKSTLLETLFNQKLFQPIYARPCRSQVESCDIRS